MQTAQRKDDEANRVAEERDETYREIKNAALIHGVRAGNMDRVVEALAAGADLDAGVRELERMLRTMGKPETDIRREAAIIMCGAAIRAELGDIARERFSGLLKSAVRHRTETPADARLDPSDVRPARVASRGR